MDLCPQFIPFGSSKSQKESSSKFFEYIGAGIPVLIESNVPEAKLVSERPFLGEIYHGRQDMLNKAKKINSGMYNYLHILKYAQKYHHPDSRARTVYDKFIAPKPLNMLHLKLNKGLNSNISGNPKVSIIITNYRNEDYLGEAIKSCLFQSYRNLEIIVVDDASARSKSLRITRPLSDGRIRYFYTKRNYGHYACCNYAMDNARGRYITFLGADDKMKKHHITSLLYNLISNRLVGICGLYSRYDLRGKVVRKARLCEASILFKKKRILRDIGYFHMVRCAADSEFRERMIKFYGENKFGLLCADTYSALQLEKSLTGDKKTNGSSKARRSYIKQFRKYNKMAVGRQLFYNFKNDNRGFNLLPEISVNDFNPKNL